MARCLPASATRRFLPAWTLTAFCVMSAGAQTAAPVESPPRRTLEQRLEDQQKLIDQLKRRIEELERATARPQSAAQEAENARALETLRESVVQISDGLSRQPAHSGEPIHGFADVGTAWSSRGDPSRLRGFGVGTLDLYLTPQFGDRVKSLMEIALYYRADGAGEIEAERMQLGYTVSDALTVWGGRFHTPIGLWNTAYHHGANLQTSIYRPRFIEFEDRDGLLPTHTIGVWGSGKTSFGSDKWTYDLYLGNGPTVRRGFLDYNAFSDDNSGKMLGANVGWHPGAALRGTTLGLHALGSTVETRAVSGALLARTRLRVFGAYAGIDTTFWEGLGEYYQFANSDLGSGARSSSRAGYAQLGRRFDALTPYLRYERAALAPGDMYFASQTMGRSYTRTSLGARYDLGAKAALKAEFGATREAAVTLLDDSGVTRFVSPASYRRLAFEYSIAF